LKKRVDRTSVIRPAISLFGITPILVLALGCILGPPPHPVPTVRGSEAADLVQRMRGYLIWPDRSESNELSAIRVLTLSSMKEHKITPSTSDGSRFVHALSGPDRMGRIAFIQSGIAHQPHIVKVINVDGSGEREIERAPAMAAGGRHPWLDPGIGEHISISPVGGRVAFIRERHGAVGTLEVLNLETLERDCTTPGAVDWGISWSPDGRRIAYVEYLPREQVPMPGDATFKEMGIRHFESREEVPAIVTLGLDTRQRTVIGPGLQPVVSAGGEEIIVRDFSGNSCAIEIASGKYVPINPPGILGAVVAYLPGGLVLYQSRPTEGQPVEQSPYGSFRAGMQMLPIKVCDPSTGAFQTIIKAVDPRHQVSYGAQD
jgi:WD40-like Beta Propeller Repeat